MRLVNLPSNANVCKYVILQINNRFTTLFDYLKTPIRAITFFFKIGIGTLKVVLN